MKPWLWLLLSLFAAAIAGLYTHKLRDPWDRSIDAEHSRVQRGDLYPRWVGTRELLLHKKDPYGTQVSHEIQAGFYGHVIEQTYTDPKVEIVDEQRFAYPIYVIFLLAPTVYLDFALVQTWAPVILAALTAISVVLCLDILRWRPPKITIAALVLCVLASPQVVQALRLRQLALLVGFLLVLSAWCVTRNHLATAGAVLAFSTIKPQMALLPLLWFLVWSIGSWPRRWRLPAAFGIMLSALVGLGEFLLPGWPRQFIQGLLAYQKYFPTTSLLRLALGDAVGYAVSAIFVAGVAVFAFRNRQSDGASQQFYFTLSVFLICAALVFPIMTPFNQILLLLPVTMILQNWNYLSRPNCALFAILVCWPWIIELALMLHPAPIEAHSRLPLLPSIMQLVLPFAVALLAIRGRSPGAPAAN